ncbi:ATP-dependent DNA helicase DinG [Saccharospirillum sp. HFRX-1]|uniref:ATP-dependent DNA helicase DinG n=1 Tax=unclassified Saccharospirillum TaxID=2633430 RepID=UPI003716C7BB
MLSDELKESIQTAYSRYLAARELKPRSGQKQMLAQIARTLASVETSADGLRQGRAPIAVIEAGTGTGKTIGYALSAIPMAQHHNKKLIIATATVALQEQVVQKDIPDLLEHSGLSFNAVLAKGRGRYLCLQRLEQSIQLQEGAVTALALFEEAMTADEAVLSLYNEMLDKFGRGDWNGDRDQWPDRLDDEQWRGVTSTHRECLNRRCPHFQNCPFFEARKELDEADVIIANHDLVMADLALGGGAILPAPAESIYVFDEGHHLPDKGLSHFASQLPVKNTLNQFENWRKQLPKLRLELAYGDTEERLLDALNTALGDAHSALTDAWGAMSPIRSRLDGHQATLAVQDADWLAQTQSILAPLEQPFTLLQSSLLQLDEQVRKRLSATNDLDEKSRLEQSLPVVGRWLSRAEPARDLVLAWRQQDAAEAPPMARWFENIDRPEYDDLVLNASPVSAQSILRQHIWNRCFASVVTSATLTIAGDFQRYAIQAGLPDGTDYLRLGSPFDYRSRVLARVPALACDGGLRDPHTQAMIEAIPAYLPTETGNLVLFSSRKQMQEVYRGLPEGWQERVTLQDDLPKNALIQHHRQRLEDGLGSTLFGLASLAEGVDLPGNYLTHLMIAKLPFATPDDPILSTLSLWLEQRGSNPFQQVSLPTAIIRLVQACGRLIRNENDSGTLWFMDRRLIDKRYGALVRQSLPDYNWQVD